MPKLNQRTLKFLVEFFQEVVDYEPNNLGQRFPDDQTLSNKGNRMTAYNIAVCVGPNIFRTKTENASILNHGVFYDCFIRLIENYDSMFEIDCGVAHVNRNKLDYRLDELAKQERKQRYETTY